METILRSEEMAEIMLIPVRHHSPACACHIKKIFAQWKPDAVLVEGPDNANALLPVMVHSDTRAPFAIYYAYHDKAKKSRRNSSITSAIIHFWTIHRSLPHCARHTKI